MKVGEQSKIPLKGVEQKIGEGKKHFKKEGKLGQGVRVLKRESDWNPFTSYGSC